MTKWHSLALGILVLGGRQAMAQAPQLTLPEPSPAASVTQRVGLTDITITRTRDTITAHVRLPGGQHHTLTMPVPPTAAQMRKTPAAAIAAIDELLDHHTHAQIAGILNDPGLVPGL